MGRGARATRTELLLLEARRVDAAAERDLEQRARVAEHAARGRVVRAAAVGVVAGVVAAVGVVAAAAGEQQPALDGGLERERARARRGRA